MAAGEMLSVEVAYALPTKQVLLAFTVAPGCTVEEAIRQSGVLSRFPEIDLSVNKVGVFGKICKLDDVLDDRDRVEIYRPLIADPKEIRRQRAAQGKVTRKGAGRTS